MPWVEIFAVFVVSHLVGDFVLQTEWQALTKTGGLTDRRARGALLSHTVTYTLAFVPALVWLTDSLGAGVLALAALVAGTHFVQDDGRLVDRYMGAVKHVDPRQHPGLRVAVDQTFHLVVLFLVALVASS